MNAPAGRPEDLNKAVLYMCFAALLIPMLNAAAKYLTQDYGVLQITWARYAGHLFYMLAVFAPVYGAGLLRTENLGLQLLRSSMLCVSTLVYVTALFYVQLPTAAAISFTAPFIVTALSPLVLGERVSVSRWFAILAGFIGAVIVLRPGDGIDLAATIVFGSAMAAACYQLLSRKLASGDRAATSITYIAVTGFVLTTIPLPFFWTTPGSALDWALFASLGLSGGFGHYFMVRAFEVAPAPFVSPFTYLQLAGAVLLGWAVFGQLPDAWVWTGSLVIVGSGVFILVTERRARAAAAPAAPRDARE